MLRVHLTSQDLGRLRIGATYGPLAETVMGLDAVWRSDSSSLFAGWRRQIASGLPVVGGRLAELMPRAWYFDLITVTGRAQSIEESLEAFLSAPRWLLQAEIEAGIRAESRLKPGVRYGRPPSWVGGLLDRDGGTRRQVAMALSAVHSVLVEPYWHGMRQVLTAEHARLAWTLANEGLDGLLDSVHPSIRWNPPILRISNPWFADRDLDLSGRGLVIVPSFFCPTGYPTCDPLKHPTEPMLLLYPLQRDPTAVLALWQGGRAPGHPLAALLGRSRAIVLQVIAEGPCTTSQLAAGAHISLSSASEHASVLRHGGLIASRRRGGAVIHQLTALGAQLIDLPTR